ncbi:MAG: hypothetical protein HY644_11215 [Acidobacteria bacterium]|nr:hypothetical protein [Acidobacteriota bacterium]
MGLGPLNFFAATSPKGGGKELWDERKEEVPKAFVALQPGYEKSAQLVEELEEHVAEQIGKIARPEEVEIVECLPKTRSGKIKRRSLKVRE